MSSNLAITISILFALLSCLSASYVEAVAGAFDASQARANLQVAMACGHFNKFLDPATRQWTDDLTSICLGEKGDILTYCQKKYPGFDVTNIVEADQAKNITRWCSEENPEDCSTTALVVPYRCLVGTFESDALVVPSQCRFRHLHEEGSCQSPQQWKRAAKSSCRKSKTKLASTGMLLPCDNQVDMYQGVEFVCCPRSGHEASPTEERPVDAVPVIKQPKPAPVKSDIDPYLKEDVNQDDESDQFEFAKERLSTKQRERVATVMQQYQEAQKKLDPSDKNYAIKKKEMSKRYEDAIADLEIETEQKQVHLQEVHESRIEDKLNKRIDTDEQFYWNSLEDEPLKSKRILRSFERYLKSVQKKRKHLISHYKHLRRNDPDKAAKVTADILTELKASSIRVDKNVEKLQKLPDIYEEIEASIANLKNTYSDNDDDSSFIQGVQEENTEMAEVETEDETIHEESEEDSSEEMEEPTGVLPQATSAQTEVSKATEEEEGGSESSSSSVGSEPSEEEDMEYPTEFRTTLNVPEDGTVADPEIPVIVVKPMESYTEEEKDALPKSPLQPLIVAKKAPLKDAHSKTEVHVRSKAYSVDKSISKKPLKSTPAIAFALACAILGVVMGLVVTVLVIKKKTRRPQVTQSFNEVDPNLTVEQRHIVSMQQNGYENPTYKYFEMQ